MKLYSKYLLAILPLAVTTSLYADQVILDDLIIDGSSCIGQDCVNGESFGFDTLRLKENNLRIKFDDTSNSGSFPSNDWQITANDSSNGGLNKFSIDDISGGRTPFTLEAGAPNHSLYVDDGGRVGVGTSSPLVELHVVNGDSPTLRLEQNGSSGFTAQTWDVAGNEAGFFIRDATNGSTLPFRILPGASSESLVIDGDDQVGIGAGTNPLVNLEVRDSSGPEFRLSKDTTTFTEFATNTEGKLTITSSSSATSVTTPVVNIVDSNSAGSPELMLNLANDGPSYLGLDNINDNSRWLMHNNTLGNFRISKQNYNDTNNLTYNSPFELTASGDLTIKGKIKATSSDFTSSQTLKENFSLISATEILTKVANLAITKWNYIQDSDTVLHIGPMAEDFHEAFGLNGDEKGTISISDISGVALASIKALKLASDEKDKKISELEKRIAALESQK
ncbi:tail fiber domain-containing protein [Shewanella aestuarii]|uniref:Tail fiber domain-containing protein n=1 Tax=Shewanella aestuarii TaxID=1028752 RepID=A0A6G9QKR5_9GAMM|nr:tail fiber domain-containing protein [Shewanella aestuarii]QIR15126.1 tail fiber domain-containing protein [Shewanella aestuarii]